MVGWWAAQFSTDTHPGTTSASTPLHGASCFSTFIFCYFVCSLSASPSSRLDWHKQTKKNTVTSLSSLTLKGG